MEDRPTLRFVRGSMLIVLVLSFLDFSSLFFVVVIRFPSIAATSLPTTPLPPSPPFHQNLSIETRASSKSPKPPNPAGSLPISSEKPKPPSASSTLSVPLPSPSPNPPPPPPLSLLLPLLLLLLPKDRRRRGCRLLGVVGRAPRRGRAFGAVGGRGLSSRRGLPQSR
jgi:hypothetical protein